MKWRIIGKIGNREISFETWPTLSEKRENGYGAKRVDVIACMSAAGFLHWSHAIDIYFIILAMVSNGIIADKIVF